MYPNTLKEKSRKGFTLAELLVVVAILAVLVAISIPIFTASTDKAEDSVCAANMRSWRGMLTTKSLTGELSAAELAVGYVGDTSSREEYKQFICPAGGTLSYRVNEDGSFEIFCSKHKPRIYNAGTVLRERVDDVINQLTSINFGSNSHIDSYATGAGLSGWYSIVKNGLPNEFSESTPTWAVINGSSGMQYVWSTEKLTLEDVGKKVPVICYNKTGETYSVGYSKVEESNNKQYPVIVKNVNTFSPTGSVDTDLDYEQAISKYEELLK